MPCAAWTSTNSDYVKEEWMDISCGIDTQVMAHLPLAAA